MNAKKKLSLLTLAFTGVLMAACGENPTDSSKPATGSSDAPTSQSAPASESTKPADLTEKDLAKGITKYTTAEGTLANLTRSGIYAASGAPHVNSYPETGIKQKLLVAPISFVKDPNDRQDNITADQALLDKINMSFVGTDDQIKQASGSNITSVKTFYEKSSFGKGAFDVVVLPCWIEYNGTATQFRNSAGGQAGVSMSSYVKSWYISEYAKENHGKLGASWNYDWKDFDSDKDGYIDLIWQVYAYPYADNSTEFWWAYVTYTGQAPNKANPNIMTLAWASTRFMSDFNGYDPHTFIHETGHTLGVNDFYDYSNTWKPMGGIDFMDQNLGDHCAYTKFMYGWVNPYILKEDDLADGKVAEITLRAQTLTGDCLVLASPDYNGTAFDEYLMLELVGPYGLCERDYKSGYSNVQGFTKPGIRITHVDGRMYQDDHNRPVSDPNLLGRNGGDTRVCNTPGGRIGIKHDTDFWPNEDGSVKTYFTEQSIIESSIDANNNWTVSPNFTANNGSLFTKGQRFTLSNKSGWAKTFMPSGTNLWNKAKTITGWNGSKQQFTIDETKTCNYYVKVKNIVEDKDAGAIATLEIYLSSK